MARSLSISHPLTFSRPNSFSVVSSIQVLPEHHELAFPPPARGSGLQPLPPRFTRCMSDLTPSPAEASSRSLSSEETTPDSMRLRRMKDRLREMRQWWDEIMKEEEEEEYCQVAKNGKIISQQKQWLRKHICLLSQQKISLRPCWSSRFYSGRLVQKLQAAVIRCQTLQHLHKQQ